MKPNVRKFFVGLVIGMFLASSATAFATIIGALPYTLTNGSTADATQVMADYNKIVSDTNTNAAHNGVNSDITALTALSTPLTVAQGGTIVFTGGNSTGSANAQVTASVVPSGMILSAGQTVCFIPGFTNIGATTLVANGLTAKNVFRQSPSGVQALTGGEIVSGGWTCATYDGTQYVLRTSGFLAPGVGPVTTLASAGTTDLGTIASHNVSITGTTGITAFGSTASATFPAYKLKFTGALTITYNASSMITPGAQDVLTAANDTATALYLGSGNWQITDFTPALKPPAAALGLGGAAQFTATNNSGTPNTQIDITAGQALMVDTNGYGKYASSVSLTINAGTTGANGLDAGSLANNTWYYEYLISNGTLTRGLLSTSAAAPTMPSGYTYKVRTGEMRTGGSATFFRTRQLGRLVRFQVIAGGTTVALPVLATLSATQTRTAVAWAACAPPDTTSISFVLSVAQVNNSLLVLAPSSDAGYAAAFSNTAPAPFAAAMNSAPNTNVTTVVDIVPESANVYYSTLGQGASDGINCYGWTSAGNVS